MNIDTNSPPSNRNIDMESPPSNINTDIEFPPSNKNFNVESLLSTSFNTFSHRTDVSLQILLSDTPRKVCLKRKVVSLGRLFAEKSNTIRKLQKKDWNRQKQIFKLKSVIKELGEKNLISNDNVYTLMEKFGPNQQLINRLFQKTTKRMVRKQYQEELRVCYNASFFSGKAYDYAQKIL